MSTTAILPGAEGSGITGELSWGDQAAPTLVNFSTDSESARYGEGQGVSITMTLSEFIAPGTSLSVEFDTGESATLYAVAAGNDPTKTLTGTYTVGPGVSTNALTVESVAAGTVTDLYGNAFVALSTVAEEKNLNSTSTILIDTEAPNAVIDNVELSSANLTITLNGSGFGETGATFGTDITSYIAWDKFAWDIDGDFNSSSEGVDASAFTFDLVTNTIDYYVSSTTLNSASKITIQLTEDGFAALKQTPGFAESGVSVENTSDDIDISAGFIKDIFGNASETDSTLDATISISYSDSTGPRIQEISSPTNDTYNGEGLDEISLVVTLNEEAQAGNSLTLQLGTGDTVQFTTATNSTQLTGTYAISSTSTATTNDLTVSSVTASSVTDLYGNALNTALPSGENLSDNNNIVIDTTDPSVALSSVSYDSVAKKLIFVGSNMETMGLTNNAAVTGDSIATLFDWTQLTWDIVSGSGATTTPVNISSASVSSVVVKNTTTMEITLTDDFVTTLEGTVTDGFAAEGGRDEISVAQGFIKDVAGNTSSTDAMASETISYTDVSPPTILSVSSVNDAGTIIDGAYSLNQALQLQVELSESVMNAGEINLTLNTGDVVTLSREAGVADNLLRGDFTVNAGSGSVNELSVSSVEIDGIKDLYGNTMVSTSIPGAESLSANNNIRVDTIAIFNASDSLGADQWVFNFTEAVNNAEGGAGSVINQLQSEVAAGTGVWSEGNKTLTYTLDETATSDITFDLDVSDFAGNDNTISYSFEI